MQLRRPDRLKGSHNTHDGISSFKENIFLDPDTGAEIKNKLHLISDLKINVNDFIQIIDSRAE